MPVLCIYAVYIPILDPRPRPAHRVSSQSAFSLYEPDSRVNFMLYKKVGYYPEFICVNRANSDYSPSDLNNVRGLRMVHIV